MKWAGLTIGLLLLFTSQIAFVAFAAGFALGSHR
jgi:hypothetical protein